MYSSWSLSVLSLSYLLFACPANTLSINRTIDDELGDSVSGVKPTYIPADSWNLGTECSTCNIGSKNIDVNQAFDGTWHDVTYRVGGPTQQVQVSFAGTAVYAYFIVPNHIAGTTTFINTTFAVDDVEDGVFSHSPNVTDTDIAYRQAVYAKTGLANANHTLLITAGGESESLVLFDYVVYTAEVDTTSTPSPSPSPANTGAPAASTTSESGSHRAPVGAIVGGTIGAVLGIAALGALVLLFLRRRRSRSRQSASASREDFEGKVGGGSSSQLVGAVTPYSASYSDDVASSAVPPSAAAYLYTSTPSKFPRPPPSVSATSEQQVALTRRISVLEERMRAMAIPLSPSGVSSVSPWPSTSASSVTDAATATSLQGEVAALRRELEELNVRLAQEQMAIAEHPPPRYDS